MYKSCYLNLRPIWDTWTSRPPEWYLTMTPELLSQASQRFEHYALGVAENA
jgi:hypothetical protein